MTASICPEALRRVLARGLRSGVIFDTLHLVVVREDGAEVPVTFNAADFERLRERGDPRIVAPPDPPALPRRW